MKEKRKCNQSSWLKTSPLFTRKERSFPYTWPYIRERGARKLTITWPKSEIRGFSSSSRNRNKDLEAEARSVEAGSVGSVPSRHRNPSASWHQIHLIITEFNVLRKWKEIKLILSLLNPASGFNLKWKPILMMTKDYQKEYSGFRKTIQKKCLVSTVKECRGSESSEYPLISFAGREILRLSSNLNVWFTSFPVLSPVFWRGIFTWEWVPR